MKKKIISYIDSMKEEFIKDLKSLVDIKSVRGEALPGKPFGEGPARALARAAEISAEHGFSMVNMENYAGEISFGENPAVMLLAHLDVVDEGDFWTKKPYDMTVEDGKLYGRGTTDDKGPALACLYALEALRELFGEPVRGVRLVMGCGEETGSEDMEYYFSKREKLLYTFSPDADYPVINLEKGRYAPSFYKKADNAGGKTVLSIKGGTTANIVPCKSEAVLKGYTPEEISEKAQDVQKLTGVSFSCEENNDGVSIKALGVSAHAAMPHTGRNAQQALIHLILSLNPDKNELVTSLQYLYNLFPYGDTAGEAAGIMMSDEKSGALTLNAGVLSYKDGVLSGNADIRIPLCGTAENVKGVLDKKLEDGGFTGFYDDKMIPVHYVPGDSPAVKASLEVYEEFTGEKGECLSIGGGTYVHGIEGGIAFGTEFPGRDYHIHGADEYADADELLLTAKMYAAVIYRLCY